MMTSQRSATLLLLALLLVSCPGALLEAQATRPANQDSIQALLHDLDSSVFATREKALKKLRDLGSRARPQLVAALPGLSLNARLQVEALLDEIAEEGPTYKARLAGTMISWAGEEALAGDVLDVLSREAGFRFAKNPGLDVKAAFFHPRGKIEALRLLTALCTRMNLRWVLDFNSGLIRFYRGGAVETPVESYQGCLRLALTSLTINTTMQFGGERTSQCYIRGQLEIEPLADVLGVLFQPRIATAKDNQGRSLMVEDTGAVSFQTTSNRRSFNFNLRLKQPERDARSIAVLKLTVPLVVPSARTTVTLPMDQTISGTTPWVEKDGVRARMARIEKAGTRRFLSLQLQRTVPQVEASRAMDVAHQNIILVDNTGREEEIRVRISRTVNPKHELLRFELPPGDWQTLHLTAVTALEIKMMEFAFKDIELP